MKQWYIMDYTNFTGMRQCSEIRTPSQCMNTAVTQRLGKSAQDSRRVPAWFPGS